VSARHDGWRAVQPSWVAHSRQVLEASCADHQTCAPKAIDEGVALHKCDLTAQGGTQYALPRKPVSPLHLQACSHILR
jgi:hypothetical protein